MKREFRISHGTELRAADNSKPGISGYAAVFNEQSEDLGFFREVILPGAFKDSLATHPDVRCLFNHDPNNVLGRTKAGTLRLAEDAKGLHFDCDLPDTRTAQDLLASITRGDVDQCSFAFFVRAQKWSETIDADGNPQIMRELHAVDVFDVSPVTYPAYPQTSVDERALWPDGAPRHVRLIRAGLLRRDSRFRIPEGRQAEECACECSGCENGNCDFCTNVMCDDEACRAAGCPNQGQTPDMNARPQAGELRGAVPFKKTPAVDTDTWDGGAARDRLAKWASSDGSADKDKMDWAKYEQGFAWFDAANKENFGAYKLPHHDIQDGKLVSVWGGVKGSMGALLGARGGTSIPEGDRKAVYGHLKKEYALHGKDAPDFNALAADAEMRERMLMALALRA